MKKLLVILILYILFNYISYGQTNLQFVPVYTWAYGSCGTASVSRAGSNLFYIGEGGTFVVVDITDPANPSKYGEVITPGVISKIVVSRFAYLADNQGGLRIIDLTNQNSPIEKGAFPGFVTTLAVSGNYCYISGGSDLTVLDISNPAVPLELGTGYPSGAINDIAVSGNYVYAVGSLGLFTAGLNIFNVSDPSHPINVSFSSYVGAGGTPRGITIVGNYAYIVGSNGLAIIDISIPTNPILKGSIGLPGYGNKIQVEGIYAHIADDKGYTIVNISNPSKPIIISHLNTSVPPTGVATFSSMTVISDGGNGLRIINRIIPSSPKEVGFYDTPGSLNQVVVRDKYAYIAADGGIYILDISIPFIPNEVGHLKLPGRAWDISISGNYAYIADDSSGLRIIDITDNSHPKEVGFYLSPGPAKGVIALGAGYVMLAAGSSGLIIINATDPTKPEMISNLSTQGEAQKISWFGGRYAFVANYYGGLCRIDVSDLANPQTPYILNNDISYNSVLTTPAFGGEYAFAAAGSKGIRVIDVGNPYFVEDIGGIKTQLAIQLTVDNQYLYCVDFLDGLHVADISDPRNIKEIGSYVIKNNARGIAVAKCVQSPDTYVYIACGEYGLYILKQDINATGINSETSNLVKKFSLFQNYPNPFNPTTEIDYSIPYEGKVKITIFNSLGKEVQTLINEQKAPGNYSIEFHGNNLPSGIYFYKLQSGNYVDTKKFVLLK